MIGPMQIGAVVLASPDPERLAGFYRKGLDLPEPKPHGPDHFGMKLANTYLGFERATARATPSKATVWFEVDDCRAACERLLAVGARAVTEPARDARLGELLATVLDPEGNPIGLVQHL